METVFRGGYRYLAKDGIARVFHSHLRALGEAYIVGGLAIAFDRGRYFLVRMPDAAIFTDEQEET